MRTVLLLGAATLAVTLGTAQAQTNAQTGAPADTVPTPRAAPAKPAHHVTPRQRRAAEAGAEPDGAAPPTSAYQGGAGSPYSTKAANITSGRGELGARLPMPNTTSDTPEALLAAAQTALGKGQTGAAQQALEMDESRALTRTTDPAMASQPDTARMVQSIADARQALGRRDMAAARAAIQSAMAAPVPPRGPATTTGPVMYR